MVSPGAQNLLTLLDDKAPTALLLSGSPNSTAPLTRLAIEDEARALCTTSAPWEYPDVITFVLGHWESACLMREIMVGPPSAPSSRRPYLTAAHLSYGAYASQAATAARGFAGV